MAKQRKRQKKGKATLEQPDDGFPRAVIIPNGRGSKSVGKLRGMLRMPMDVFQQIASFLEPLDLLHLARTSKPLRENLMSKRSLPVWRAAWDNVSTVEERYGSDEESAAKVTYIPGYTPPCPPGMSEPLLVALTCDGGYCTACGRRTTYGPNLVLGVRACKNCPVAGLQFGIRIIRALRKELGVAAAIKKSNSDFVILSMVPSEKPTSWLIPMPFISEDDRNKHNWKNLVNNLFVEATFREVAKRYYALVKAGDTGLDAFVEEKQREVEERWAQIEKVHDYFLFRDHENYRTERKLSEAFEKDVYAKLAEMGYTDDDLKVYQLSSDQKNEFRRLVSQPVQLTPKIWENLFPRLEYYVERVRRRQHEKKLRSRRSHLFSLIKDRISHGNTGGEGKTVIDTRNYSLVSEQEDNILPITKFLDERMQDPVYDYDEVEVLSEKDWTKLVEYGILEMLEGRRNTVTRSLLHLLIRGVSGLNVEEVDQLLSDSCSDTNHDISALFASRFPESGIVIPTNLNLHHPAAFFHSGEVYGYEKLHSYDDIFNSLDKACWFNLLTNLARSESKPSRRTTWFGDPTGVEIAMALLGELGYTPRSSDCGSGVHKQVSMRDMLDKGAVFVCMRCPQEGRTRMGWKDLVLHFYHEALFVKDARTAMSSGNTTIPISNAHDYHPHLAKNNSETTTTPPVGVLAIESEDFVDGPCPYDGFISTSHIHDIAMPGLAGRFICTICRGTVGYYPYDWLQCAEMHVRTRHGKNAEEGDIQSTQY